MQHRRIWNSLRAVSTSWHPTSLIHSRTRISTPYQISHLPSLPQAVCLSTPLKPASSPICLLSWKTWNIMLCCCSINRYTHIMIMWAQACEVSRKSYPHPFCTLHHNTQWAWSSSSHLLWRCRQLLSPDFMVSHAKTPQPSYLPCLPLTQLLYSYLGCAPNQFIWGAKFTFSFSFSYINLEQYKKVISH